MSQGKTQLIGKKYFQVSPLNNVTAFSFTAGQDVVRFALPKMDGALLDDLVIMGNLQLDTDAAATPVTTALTTDGAICCDSVCGINAFISKVELSTRQGNMLIEQRNNYDLISKVRKCPFNSANDLNVGISNVQELGSEHSAGSAIRVPRNTGVANGSPFAFQINAGFLSEAVEKVDLGLLGGLEIVVYLNSDRNALMNLSSTQTNLLGAGNYLNVRYTLRNLQLFGAYQMYGGTPPNAQVNFKQTSNNLQVVNSSNDVNGFSPQVMSLDHILVVSQPNSDSKNKFSTNAQQTNQLIGLQTYKVARNGMPFPMDFRSEVVTAIPDQQVNASGTTVSGNAEQLRHLIVSTAGKYPGYHMTVSADAESVSNEDWTNTDNYNSTNFMPIGISYQYGFDGYSTPMQSDLVQVSLESAVLTSDANVPTNIRDQAQTANNLYKYNTVYGYQTMMVQK
jgi:hypothetical protein